MDGGQSSPYVAVEFTKNIILYFPNFNARRNAVLMHDIHHIVTGYPSTFTGETEIGAWEIGSGCKKYWAAWILDISGMMAGIIYNLSGVLKAFARGRRTINLYHHTINTSQAMDMTVGEIEKALMLDIYSKDTRPDITDIVAFAWNTLWGLLLMILSALLIPFIIGYTIYIRLQKRCTIAHVQ